MKQLPDLKKLSAQEKDSLIVELWQTIQELKISLEKLEKKQSLPKKTSKNSSKPPSTEFKDNKTDNSHKSPRRKASLGRKGGGRKLNPNPERTIVTQVKHCLHCQEKIAKEEQKLTALYEKIEIPPIKPTVTRIERYGVHCSCCGKDYLAPVPVGMEQGTPFGDSIISLVTYLRYTHAIR